MHAGREDVSQRRFGFLSASAHRCAILAVKRG